MNVSKELLVLCRARYVWCAANRPNRRSVEEYARFDDMAAKFPEVFRSTAPRPTVRLAADGLVAHIGDEGAMAGAESEPIERLISQGWWGRHA